MSQTMQMRGALARSPKVRYAVHFPEISGPGHLLINVLAAGIFGIALLVLAADGKLCVKKIEKQSSRQREDGSHCPEVTYYTSHPNIPTLWSSIEYKFPPGNRNFPPSVKNTTTWQFCNGGNLYVLLLRVRGISSSEDTRSGLPLPPVRVPENFLWHFFQSMLSLLVELHTQGLAHNDLHPANIFLHWPTLTSVFPTPYAGDFGLAVRYPSVSHPQTQLNQPWQIRSMDQLQPLGTANFRRCFDWYGACFRDHANLARHLLNLFTVSFPLGARDLTHLERAVRARLDLDGYSALLVQSIHRYCQLWIRVGLVYGPAYDPADLMRQTQEILDSVRQTAEARTRVAQRRLAQVSAQQQQNPGQGSTGQHRRYQADEDVHNILQEIRPLIPKAVPALWHDADDIGTEQSSQFLVDLPNDEVLLDQGTYRILRVKQIRQGGEKRWHVLGDDEDSDDIETDDGHAPGDNDDDDDDNDDDDGNDSYRINTRPIPPFQLYNKPAEDLTNEEIRDILASALQPNRRRTGQQAPNPPGHEPRQSRSPSLPPQLLPSPSSSPPPPPQPPGPLRIAPPPGFAFPAPGGSAWNPIDLTHSTSPPSQQSEPQPDPEIKQEKW